MKTMAKRTTISLDNETVRKLHQLSQLWGVSQAEAIRRAIESADQTSSYSHSLAAKYQEYLDKGGLSSQAAEQYLQEWTQDRATWRDQ